MKRFIKFLSFSFFIMSMCLGVSSIAFANENIEQLPPNHEVVDVEYVPYDYFIETPNNVADVYKRQ